MKSFFSNVWTKRFVAIIASLYTVGVCFLAYFSIFYSFHIDDRLSLCLVVSSVSVIALILMLYTRKQILTRLSSFLILIFMVPVVLLNFSEKSLIIPIIITGILILLFSGAGEGTKTVIGTVILLMYVFSALGYFLFTSFFVTVAKTEVIESGESPSGKYRYSIINTEDTSNGSTAIYIEPNYADVTYPFITFKLKNIKRAVYQVRPMCEEINIEWTNENRANISEQLNEISDNIEVSLSQEELETLGYTMENTLEVGNVNVYILLEAGYTASDVRPIKLDDLSDEQLALFDIGREKSGRYYVLNPTDELLEKTKKTSADRIYFTELNKKQLKIFNNSHLDEYDRRLFEIQKNYSVPFKSLTDEQLAGFGISESGDVLKFNGKVCFRYYVAELENYFDVDSRTLSLELLNPTN